MGVARVLSGDSSADRFDFPTSTTEPANEPDDERPISQDEFDAEVGSYPDPYEYDDDYEDGYADGLADAEADAFDP